MAQCAVKICAGFTAFMALVAPIAAPNRILVAAYLVYVLNVPGIYRIRNLLAEFHNIMDVTSVTPKTFRPVERIYEPAGAPKKGT